MLTDFHTETDRAAVRRPRRLSSEERDVLDHLGFGGWFDVAAPQNESLPFVGIARLVERGWLARPNQMTSLYRLTEKGRRGYASL